jgi:hypothetical protein
MTSILIDTELFFLRKRNRKSKLIFANQVDPLNPFPGKIRVF